MDSAHVGMDSLSVEQWESQMKLFNDLYDNIAFTNAQYYAGLDEEMRPNGDVSIWNMEIKLRSDRSAYGIGLLLGIVF